MVLILIINTLGYLVNRKQE